jgi:hypothetical protein
MQNTHRLAVEVFTEEGYWAGHATGVAGCITADTLLELFAEVELFKHFCLGVPKETPVSVEYVAVAEQPEIAEELCAAYRGFLAMPEDVRPRAIPWNHDNDRPLNASAAPLINR